MSKETDWGTMHEHMRDGKINTCMEDLLKGRTLCTNYQITYPPKYVERDPIEHELKIDVKYFEDVWKMIKPFEVRYNDRGYQVGDTLLLREYDVENNSYTGRCCTMRITYILDDRRYLVPGYVILGLTDDVDGEIGRASCRERV